MRWSVDQSLNSFGQFAVYADTPKKPRRNVTYFRSAPTRISSFSFGDPFGDATAELIFPSVTPYDDPESKQLWWLKPYTNFDIVWVPATDTKLGNNDLKVIDPRTNKKTLWLNYGNAVRLWEGFSISYEPTPEGVRIQLQGALYQVDRYISKPEFPSRPYTMETLLKRAFDPDLRYLRTKPLQIVWPAGWTKTFEGGRRTLYRPRGVAVGENWTGFSSRATGDWRRLLTGFCADLLSQMYVLDDCGATPGNQWTIRKSSSRRPILTVRDRFAAPDFTLWYGTPGAEISLMHDSASTVNVIYGEGTGEDGVAWSRMEVDDDERFTHTWYKPLTALDDVYPYDDGEAKATLNFPSETMIKFGVGVSAKQGRVAAEKMLARDSEAGWTGEIRLQIHPAGINRWKIKAGDVVCVKGVAGIREGINLHIAEVVHSPESNTTTLKVDSQFRDLLTLEEVQARVRDPLTPVKMLQVGKRSVTVEDMLSPWSYSAGSGMIPLSSRKFWRTKPDSISFPWDEWTQKYPPSRYGENYIRCKASSSKSSERWSFGRVLLSQSGSAALTQIMAVDRDGNLAKVPFHVSIYYIWLDYSSMPQTNGNWSPFLPNHFQNIALDGAEWGPGEQYAPPPSIIVGWGNDGQRAGFSPARDSDGANPTGLLIDQSQWTWNLANQQQDFDPRHADPGPDKDYRDETNQLKSNVACWVGVYAEHTEDVYFIGRVYRLEPGS